MLRFNCVIIGDINTVFNRAKGLSDVTFIKDYTVCEFSLFLNVTFVTQVSSDRSRVPQS